MGEPHSPVCPTSAELSTACAKPRVPPGGQGTLACTFFMGEQSGSHESRGAPCLGADSLIQYTGVDPTFTIRQRSMDSLHITLPASVGCFTLPWAFFIILLFSTHLLPAPGQGVIMNEPVQMQPYLSRIKDINLLRFLSDEEIAGFLAVAEVVAFQKREKSSTQVMSAHASTELSGARCALHSGSYTTRTYSSAPSSKGRCSVNRPYSCAR